MDSPAVMDVLSQIVGGSVRRYRSLVRNVAQTLILEYRFLCVQGSETSASIAQLLYGNSFLHLFYGGVCLNYYYYRSILMLFTG